MDDRRRTADPEADAVVRAAAGLTSGADPGPTGLTPMISALRALDPPAGWAREWVTQPSELPPWADPAAVAAGQRFFASWDLDIVTALFCASLPFAYAAAKGVEVLAQVSELASGEQVARRIAETGRWLVATASPGGLAPGSAGRQRTREVRLLHAAIRADLNGHWDNGGFGCPINQEDLLGTLLSFTTVVFRSLERLGTPVSREDRIAYLHLWAVIGDTLGILDAPMICDPDRAEALGEDLALRLHAPSAAGRHLTAVLMAEMELSMPWGLRRLPTALVRYLSGDAAADLLGVAPAPWWTPGLAALGACSRAFAPLPWGTSALRLPSRLLGRSVIRMWIDRSIAGDHLPPFHAEEAVLVRWKIRTSPSRQMLTVRGRARCARYRRRVRTTASGARRPDAPW